MEANWREFWMYETEMGQQVAQHRGTYMMMMMMMMTTTNYSSKQQIVQLINLLI
jgi:hypothetical protein